MPLKCFTRGHDWKNRISKERLDEILASGAVETWREAMAQQICSRCNHREFIYRYPPMAPIYRATIAVVSLSMAVVAWVILV